MELWNFQAVREGLEIIVQLLYFTDEKSVIKSGHMGLPWWRSG